MFTMKLLLAIWGIVSAIVLGYKIAVGADRLEVISCQLWFLIALVNFYFY